MKEEMRYLIRKRKKKQMKIEMAYKLAARKKGKG
jgi:hypothetical protein